MLLMGDEIGRSQGGNNNSYCQDNEMNWLQWSGVSERDQAFSEFLAKVIRIRKSHPLLRQTRFLHANRVDEAGMLDVQWLRPDGQAMEDGDWLSGGTRAVGMLLANKTERVFLMCNAHHEAVDFTLPPMVDEPWHVLIDTAEGTADPRGRTRQEGDMRSVQARSLVLLESRA